MNLDELALGDELTWLYTPKGGYGYTIPVDAKVVAIRKRIKVEVVKYDGTPVHRWVKPESLRKKSVATQNPKSVAND